MAQAPRRIEKGPPLGGGTRLGAGSMNRKTGGDLGLASAFAPQSLRKLEARCRDYGGQVRLRPQLESKFRNEAPGYRGKAGGQVVGASSLTSS